MATIARAVVFNKKVRVSVVKSTDIVNRLIKIHQLSPVAADALGRAITVGAYIVGNFKDKNNRLNLIIDGGGALGKIIVSGTNKTVKGFVENPNPSISVNSSEYSLAAAVGKSGNFTVIEDLGLKEPYVGNVSMVSGEIAQDYANYLLKSQGIKNAVALGVLCDKDGCLSAGGIFIEALPGATEEIIVVLEDIMTNFDSFSSVIKDKTPNEIIDYYFGHFDIEIFEEEEIKLYCNCKTKIYNTVKGLGKEEAFSILNEHGGVHIHCDYCGRDFTYDKRDLAVMFGEPND